MTHETILAQVVLGGLGRPDDAQVLASGIGLDFAEFLAGGQNLLFDCIPRPAVFGRSRAKSLGDGLAAQYLQVTND